MRPRSATPAIAGLVIGDCPPHRIEKGGECKAVKVNHKVKFSATRTPSQQTARLCARSRPCFPPPRDAGNPRGARQTRCGKCQCAVALTADDANTFIYLAIFHFSPHELMRDGFALRQRRPRVDAGLWLFIPSRSPRPPRESSAHP